MKFSAIFSRASQLPMLFENSKKLFFGPTDKNCRWLWILCKSTNQKVCF